MKVESHLIKIPKYDINKSDNGEYIYDSGRVSERDIIIDEFNQKEIRNFSIEILNIRKSIFNIEKDKRIELKTFIDYFKFYDYINQLKCYKVDLIMKQIFQATLKLNITDLKKEEVEYIENINNDFIKFYNLEYYSYYNQLILNYKIENNSVYKTLDYFKEMINNFESIKKENEELKSKLEKISDLI